MDRIQEANPSGFSAMRTLVVGGLGLFVLGVTLPGLIDVWQPPGDIGLVLDFDNVVKAVATGSPAALAGIVPGDRIDVRRTPFEDRYETAMGRTPRPGQRLSFYVVHGRTERAVTLVAKAAPLSQADAVTNVLSYVSEIIFVVVGGFLTLRKPSRMTRAFYAYCLLVAYVSSNDLYSNLPNVLWLARIFATSILVAAGNVGLLIFALRFPADTAPGWRGTCERAMPYFFASVAVATIYADVVAANLLGTPGELVRRVDILLGYIGIGAAITAMFATYVSASGTDRQRLKWVIASFLIGPFALLSAVLLSTTSLLPVNPPLWVLNTFTLLNSAVPLSIAYAVIRHRVIDLNFAVSRVLVYGILTTVLVAVFALIDWFFGHQLAATRLTLPLEIAAAIGFGFWLNGLHRGVDRFVDHVLFRRRHLAELRLARVAAALPHAKSPDAVADFVALEPAYALELASGALFRRSQEDFVRSSSVGWSSEHTSMLSTDDPLVVQLEAQESALRMSELRWPHSDVPSGAAAPAFALPIVVRHQLCAIGLYGAHTSGADLDSAEVEIIGRLATGAGAAYDHLEAEAHRQEVEELRRRNDALRRDYDALVQSMATSLKSGSEPATG